MMTGMERDWRQICKEVLREKNSDKLIALLEELLLALDARAQGSSHSEGQEPRSQVEN